MGTEAVGLGDRAVRVGLARAGLPRRRGAPRFMAPAAVLARTDRDHPTAAAQGPESRPGTTFSSRSYETVPMLLFSLFLKELPLFLVYFVVDIVAKSIP